MELKLILAMLIDKYNRFVHLMINMSKIIRKDNNTKNDILEVLNNKDMLQSILNCKEKQIKIHLPVNQMIVTFNNTRYVY